MRGRCLVDRERYYVVNSTLVANSEHQPSTVLLGSIDELEAIKDILEPGTLAHVAGSKAIYELGSSREWTAVANETVDVSGAIEELKGAANGLAELNESGKVPASQLPSYVDDVIEYNTLNDFPITGETGKIYVSLNDNKTYRWGGSEYVNISGADIDPTLYAPKASPVFTGSITLGNTTMTEAQLQTLLGLQSANGVSF